MSTMDFPSNLHNYTRESWNEMAQYWVNVHGEKGNEFHIELVSPTAEKLLNVKSGVDEILEIACGSGVFAKRLHELGAKLVVATDFSSEFLKATIENCKGLSNMKFFCLDATDEKGIVEMVGFDQFDKAVCNMGIMDMTEIDPLFSAMFKVLRPGGVFVFTTMHPCFNGNAPIKGIEEVVNPLTHTMYDIFYIKQSEYLQWKPTWGRGLPDQPIKQLYFHRPLHELFATICRNGFVVDGFEEPSFTIPADIERKRKVIWRNFTQFPPILGIRCRKLGI